ncbi:NAD(P)-dependent oxidoreductase [Halosquirtibacter laminarini]|uniref:NAD(P)-dependent oxidoreductase n=1 Tax=Halosquirtibacter laminarini TaxID=3374600 RepID=A0AC61NBE5_9BACT|nr:NAD(P)-dependent oxidoreductase [Prolixibacteraceae bacterium]
MATILITGATGFVGSALVEKCLEYGHEVYAGIRSTSSTGHLDNEKVTFITLDLSNTMQMSDRWNELSKKGENIDYVIHAAGVTIASKQQYFDEVNDFGTRNLYKSFLILHQRPTKFVFISSLAAVGPGDPVTNKPISKDQDPEPITAYGRSKRAAEKFLLGQTEISTTIIRPTAVYGPRDKSFLQIFKAIRWGFEPYMTSPKQQLSFIHVEDLVVVIIMLTVDANNQKVYHLSDSFNYTLHDFMLIVKQVLGVKTIKIKIPSLVLRGLVEMIEFKIKLTGRASDLNRDKQKELIANNWGCDTEMLYHEVDYHPKYSLSDGLVNVLQWYKKQRLL